MLTGSQANPKLAARKDDDERLPIHWAVSYNHLPIVQLLVQVKNFDPDVQVRILRHFESFHSYDRRTVWAGHR